LKESLWIERERAEVERHEQQVECTRRRHCEGGRNIGRVEPSG
jgi:hypothetical protein